VYLARILAFGTRLAVNSFYVALSVFIEGNNTECKGCKAKFTGNNGVCPFCNFPNFAAINQVFAELEAGEGKYQQAKQTITDAIELEPNNGSLYEDRSKINISLNQSDKAIEDMANAIKLEKR